ncbi:MAG: hypothetical protein GY742_12755 [Hyphomicrobiales bacterium]|nr:hypothetical protein [Hyphomicrobiales bacterium]
MSLLVEYTLMEGKADAQIEALKTFIDGLKSLDDGGFDYTAFETDDPTKFIAIVEFDNDDAKQRFLGSAPFAEYRDGSKERFGAPPAATPIRLVGSTRG